MSKTILTTGGIPTATTANTNQYWPLAVTSIESPVTSPEANKQILYRTPGTLSKLYVKVTANTINGTSTVNVRKNGVGAGLSLTIGPNATGVFENTTNTVSVAAGDRLNYQTVPGAATGTMSISILSVLFEATNTTDTVSRLTTCGTALNYTTASASRYNVIAGNQGSANGSEIAVKCKIRKPATGKNLGVYISANARTNDTLVRTRKNAVNGACLITIGAGQTGWFEDTTNTDTLAVDDDYDVVVVTGTGTEAMTLQSTSLDLVTTSGYAQTLNARTAGFTVNAATTQYFPIGGGTNAGIAEISAQQKTRMPSQYSELIVHIPTNTVTADSTVKVRKNGTDTSITTTIPASGTGYFSDSANTETFTDTDDISLQLITGATGTSLMVRSITLSLSETVAPVIITGLGGRSRQGRSPLYRLTKPRIVAVIIRLKVQLEYEVTTLTITVAIPYVFEKVTLIKYASAVIIPLVNVLPLRKRATPKPTVRTIITQVPYEVQTLRLRSACAYEVDKLITRKKHLELLRIAMNYLVSDFTSHTKR